jgi:hypothetical protein
MQLIWVKRETKNFLRKGLDRPIAKQPVGQITHSNDDEW